MHLVVWNHQCFNHIHNMDLKYVFAKKMYRLLFEANSFTVAFHWFEIALLEQNCCQYRFFSLPLSIFFLSSTHTFSSLNDTTYNNVYRYEALAKTIVHRSCELNHRDKSSLFETGSKTFSDSCTDPHSRFWETSVFNSTSEIGTIELFFSPQSIIGTKVPSHEL